VNLDNPIERCVMEILAENYRLRAIEHAVWHLLDDSGSNGAIVTIDLAISSGAHYKRLTELLPEEHPAPVKIADAAWAAALDAARAAYATAEDAKAKARRDEEEGK